MSVQRCRAPSGGLVDRTRSLAFTFDGRTLLGHPGDTLASALLANGVRLVGRSFKYHRPRGVFGLGGEEPSALVGLRTGARAEPNQRVTQVELYDGLVATSQNRWPSLEHDVGVVNDVLSRLLPAGFYYKTFMWPASAWPLYERVIRAAAGLGRCADAPDPDRYAKRFDHCDVLIVGAGPAGLEAARAAGRSGARVILVEEQCRVGGSLLGAGEDINGRPAIEWVEATAAALAALPNVRVLCRATAFGYYDQNLVTVCERVADHLPAPEAHQPRQRLWLVRARRVVLATGAIERPLVFANNDRPGVMLASAVATYARRYGVRCGERAIVFTNNDSGYDAVDALAGVGAKVVAVVDSRAGGPGAGAGERLRRAGAEGLAGHVVTAAVGRRAVEGAEIAGFDAAANAVSGVTRTIGCDLICSAGGWNPTVHLFSQSQGRLRWDEPLGAFVPGESAQAEHSAGAARGVLDLAGCLEDGWRAGAEAAVAAGHKKPRHVRKPVVETVDENPIEPLWLVPLPAGRRGKRFVDLQDDVTAEDVGLAVREGYRSVEHLKRYTTLGMGTDQGRTSNVNGLAILAARTGSDIPSVGTTTFRPPFAPVSLGAIAGTEIDAEIQPVRRTPMQAWHERAGARFVTAGVWLRPQFYPREDESLWDSIYRETRMVRAGVGMADVSTLGKIEIRGRDAGEFLDRIYINRFSTLKPGRCRYGLMLREDGFVMDDGTTTRIGEHEWYMTTTTANAAAVMSHLEFYAQTVWPDLHVHLASVSDQWAGIAVAGPRSREVLAAACDGADVGNEVLPFMGCIEATISGAPVRLIRMTFSGERAYEVHTPADWGTHVWEALLAAGAPQGVAPYGMEAMGILRIEKGHVVGGELDGRTTPADLGFERMQKKDKDFVGRRSLEREGLTRADRRRLVGLLSENGAPIPRGAQVVWNPTAPKPVPMLGHVTAQCYSPHLGRHIGLALLETPERWEGQILYASSPLAGRHTPVSVTHHVFVDPEGARPRG